MGLTIHYRLEATTDAAKARRVVTEGSILAGRMWLRLALDDVGPVTWDERARQAAAERQSGDRKRNKDDFIEKGHLG